MDEVPKCDVLLVMGDFNACVGIDVSVGQGLVGRLGTKEQNENGQRLLDMVITNTFFQHRPCHMWT